MAIYKPGDVVEFYDDPLTELIPYGEGTLKEKVSNTNPEGLETWIASFTFEELSQDEPRQIKTPETTEDDVIENVVVSPPIIEPITDQFALERMMDDKIAKALPGYTFSNE